MSKEMMIVFVYDTESCQNESDDPVEAVLYFHPSWVSDVQRISLVGQLMGTAHFLRHTFVAKPKVISLQSGKFVLKEFGRFILAVGTDRNLPSSLLQHRADILESLLRFFHRDIQTIYEQFNTNSMNSGSSDAIQQQQQLSSFSTTPYKSLSAKLYHIFETYLPILQHNGHVFQNMPISRLPKSASNIFLDAMQTLQSCQQTKGVLGGALLFHNKVLATQLSPQITKNLVLTDPYRIKATAEPIITNFHIPVGVQMITIYIAAKEFRQLSADAQQAQTITNQHVFPSSGSLNNQSIGPFQLKKKIKRDKSIIFTNIPEEAIIEHSDQSPTTEPPPPPSKPNPPTVRPNHLPLRFKNITSKDLPESGFSSINFDETDSFPQFIGKTSVCSTPMTEMKVLNGPIMSICSNLVQMATDLVQPPKLKQKEQPPTLPRSEDKPFKMETRRHSLNNLEESLKKIQQAIRPCGMTNRVRLGKPTRDRSLSPCYAPTEDDDFEFDEWRTYRTITDPLYPVFNSAGAPISKTLFQQFLNTDEPNNNNHNNNNHTKNDISFNPAEHIDSVDSIDPIAEPINFDDFDSELKLSPIREKSLPIAALTPSRMSLSLPLKSLSLDTNGSSSAITENATNIFDTPQQRKKLAGIQLTPLMSKLSILAMNDERSSGFSSWDTTPGCGVDVATPSAVDGPKFFRRRSSVTRFEDLVEMGEDQSDSVEESNDMQRCELFVCGQHNMTMLLVLEQAAGQKQELVQKMFEMCVSRLSRIESSLSQTLNVNVDGDKTEGSYSFLATDPHWDTLQRGGPWVPSDLTTLECMRTDFKSTGSKTDLVLRTDESVVYGYQSGESIVFYKEAAATKPGIPPPADAMGTIATNAKRRLERDHSIILL